MFLAQMNYDQVSARYGSAFFRNRTGASESIEANGPDAPPLQMGVYAPGCPLDQVDPPPIDRVRSILPRWQDHPGSIGGPEAACSVDNCPVTRKTLRRSTSFAPRALPALGSRRPTLSGICGAIQFVPGVRALGSTTTEGDLGAWIVPDRDCGLDDAARARFSLGNLPYRKEGIRRLLFETDGGRHRRRR